MKTISLTTNFASRIQFAFGLLENLLNPTLFTYLKLQRTCWISLLGTCLRFLTFSHLLNCYDLELYLDGYIGSKKGMELILAQVYKHQIVLANICFYILPFFINKSLPVMLVNIVYVIRLYGNKQKLR